MFKFKIMNILIVDDNKINRMLLKHLIEEINHNTFEADDGDVAVEMVKEKDYDLIFMDMMMPKMNGYLATKYIKEDLKKNTPIYIVSAYKLEDFPDDWKSIDYNGFLSKPVNFNMITDIINKHIK
jgi:two-component system, sensor histidine kinase